MGPARARIAGPGTCRRRSVTCCGNRRALALDGRRHACRRDQAQATDRRRRGGCEWRQSHCRGRPGSDDADGAGEDSLGTASGRGRSRRSPSPCAAVSCGSRRDPGWRRRCGLAWPGRVPSRRAGARPGGASQRRARAPEPAGPEGPPSARLHAGRRQDEAKRALRVSAAGHCPAGHGHHSRHAHASWRRCSPARLPLPRHRPGWQACRAMRPEWSPASSRWQG